MTTIPSTELASRGRPRLDNRMRTAFEIAIDTRGRMVGRAAGVLVFGSTGDGVFVRSSERRSLFETTAPERH